MDCWYTLRYASLKLMLWFENPSVAGPEFWDKRKCRRPKRERRRYVSEAAPRFGNLCVYEPSALWKKPSASSKKTFWFSEETFWFAEEAFRFVVEMCILERHSMLDQIEMECRLICGSNKSTKGLQPPVESDCGGLQKKTTMSTMFSFEQKSWGLCKTWTLD